VDDGKSMLIGARKALLTQTRRHSNLVKLLGIRHVVLAVNKMDRVGWDRATFETIVVDYRLRRSGRPCGLHPDPDLGPDRGQHGRCPVVTVRNSSSRNRTSRRRPSP
jgi:hypothetical protein